MRKVFKFMKSNKQAQRVKEAEDSINELRQIDPERAELYDQFYEKGRQNCLIYLDLLTEEGVFTPYIYFRLRSANAHLVADPFTHQYTVNKECEGDFGSLSYNTASQMILDSLITQFADWTTLHKRIDVIKDLVPESKTYLNKIEPGRLQDDLTIATYMIRMQSVEGVFRGLTVSKLQEQGGIAANHYFGDYGLELYFELMTEWYVNLELDRLPHENLAKYVLKRLYKSQGFPSRVEREIYRMAVTELLVTSSIGVWHRIAHTYNLNWEN